MSKVDVLVATYNGEKYIAEQIESIINQTHKDVRIIISDDCSTDGTRDILQKYKDKDNRIELVFNSENKGLVANFEQLLNLVTSPYFALSDQDDVWYENKLELQLKTITRENLNMVISDVMVVDENLNQRNVLLSNNSNFKSKVHKYRDYRLEYLSNCAIGCTILAKKKILARALPLPKNTYVIHDYYLAIIACLTGQVLFIDEPLLYYRQHNSNLIGADKEHYETFELARDAFIHKKKQLFSIYKSLDDLFDFNIIKHNNKFYDFLIYAQHIKYFSFKGLILLLKLYRYEPFKVKIKAILILNFPILIKKFFK